MSRVWDRDARGGSGFNARTALTVVAVMATPFLVLAAADAGGWTRFGVGAVVLTVALVVLRGELIADRERRLE